MAKGTKKWKFYSMGIALLVLGYIAGNVGTFLTDEDCNAFKVSTLDAGEKAPRAVELPENVDENGFYYIGDKDAPLTMTEFTDYQCTFCQKYYFGAYQQIKETYVKEGKVKYVIATPFPYRPNSEVGTYAALCAGEQGNFFGMHEKLFTYQSAWGYSETPETEILKYVEDLKLDTEKFQTCMANSATNFAENIAIAMKESGKHGLQGTPSFTIGETPFVGAQPFASFAEIIEEAL